MITAHRQAVTRLFWENERYKYDKRGLWTPKFLTPEILMKFEREKGDE